MREKMVEIMQKVIYEYLKNNLESKDDAVIGGANELVNLFNSEINKAREEKATKIITIIQNI